MDDRGSVYQIRKVCPMNQDYQKALLTDGFVKFQNLLNPAEMDELRLKSEAVLHRTKATHRERYKSNGSLCNLAELPEFASLISDSRIIDSLREIGARDARWTSGYLISKPAGGAPLFWHQDWWGWDSSLSYEVAPMQLFVMIYLTDTQVENGCLRVIPGSHLRRHELHSLPTAHTKDIATNIDENCAIFASHQDEVAVKVTRGDVLIGDSRLLHSAYANRSSEERPLITLWYIPNWQDLPDCVQATLNAIYLREVVDIDDGQSNLATCESWPSFAYEKIRALVPNYHGATAPLEWNRTPDLNKLQQREEQ